MDLDRHQTIDPPPFDAVRSEGAGSARATSGRLARLAAPWRGRPAPVHVLLLVAYPVLFVYGANLGEVRLGDLVAPLAFVVLAAAVALAAGAYLFRDARRAALPVAALVAALLLYGHVADALREVVRIRPLWQQAGWAALVVAAFVAAVALGASRIARLTRALNLVAALLVIAALVGIVPGEVSRLGRVEARPGTVAGGAGTDREIWYLVFDRFGSERSLRAMYDIDLGPFLDGLRERGFVVLDGSHTNYVKTVLSMAATLNLDYLDELAAEMGPDSNDLGPIRDRLADHAVGRFLKDRGYEYVHLGSWFAPTRSSAIADRNLMPGGLSEFAAAVYDQSALPLIARKVGSLRGDPRRDRHYAAGTYQLDMLDRLAAEEPSQRFVLAHVLLPHPPFVFAEDGSFVPESVADGTSAAELFAAQLAYLESRLDTLLDRLLDGPADQRPIIILQADEGPYPRPYSMDPYGFDWSTASPAILESKYGILNAMYLPGRDADAPDPSPTMSSVNTFRFLFAEYFAADLPLLPDESYSSRRKDRPYDFGRITDRLPPLGVDP